MTRFLSSRFTLVSIIVLSLFAASCRKDPVAAPPPPPPAVPTPPPPAPTVTLRSDRVTLDRGQSLSLIWQARNAATVTIEPGIGQVNANGGSQMVTPPSSITYTATARGPGGEATDNVRITVEVPGPSAAAPPPAPAASPTLTIDQLFTRNMQPILFDYDEAEIRSDQIAKLQSTAAFLKQQGNIRFTVAGHADERGSQEYNLGLGDRRANAVKQYLTTQGIPESRMNIVSFGEERPECRETTEECYAQNRRAAFSLVQ